MAGGLGWMNSLGIGFSDIQLAYASTIDVTSAGSPAIGICRGHVRVGQRSSRLRNGLRYSVISASDSLRITEPGSTRSMNRLRSSIKDSPLFDRKPWNIGVAVSLHSAQPAMGRTMASMYANPQTRSR